MKLYNSLNNFIAFFILLGFYSILLISYNIFPEMGTTGTSIFIRLFLAFLILAIFIMKPFYYNKNMLFLLYTFSIIYTAKICIALFDDQTHWYRNPQVILMYYSIYAIVPFLFFAKKESRFLQNSLKMAIIHSGIVFSSLTVFFYSSFLMDFGGRISMLEYVLGEETKVLNPLIFSYVSSITIGLIICELYFNIKLKRRMKIYLFSGIIISLIPFIVGASRGSVFSLFLPFIYILFKTKYVIHRGKMILGGLTLFFLLITIVNITGSSLIDRFNFFTSDYNSSEFERLAIWKTSIEQTSQNILFGHGLQNNTFNHYPHNIFIEVLQATGVVGLSVFFAMIFYAFNLSNYLMKTKRENVWMIIIFQQGLIQAQFTGAIADSIIFWAGLGLLCSIRNTQLQSANQRIYI